MARGADVRRLRREHRHRRPGDDPRRRQEPRLRRRRHRPGRLRRRCSPSWRPTTAPRPWRCAAGWRPRPMPARPPTTRRSPAGSPARTGETFPAALTLAGSARQTLRYGENPHQQAAFYVRRQPSPARRRHRDAAPGQGAVATTTSTTPTPPSSCVAEFERARRRHHQARQSLRRRRRGDDLCSAYRSALECDPGQRLRRHRRRSTARSTPRRPSDLAKLLRSKS